MNMHKNILPITLCAVVAWVTYMHILTTAKQQNVISNISFSHKWNKTDNERYNDLIIKNNNSVDLKDIEITCDYFAPSGTRIDGETFVIYEKFPVGVTISKSFHVGFLKRKVIEKGQCYISSVSKG